METLGEFSASFSVKTSFSSLPMSDSMFASDLNEFLQLFSFSVLDFRSSALRRCHASVHKSLFLTVPSLPSSGVLFRLLEARCLLLVFFGLLLKFRKIPRAEREFSVLRRESHILEVSRNRNDELNLCPFR